MKKFTTIVLGTLFFATLVGGTVVSEVPPTTITHAVMVRAAS